MRRPDFSDEKSDSSSTSSAISESSMSSDDGSPASSELQQSFAAVVDIIDNLYKRSRSIRTPALQVQLLKVSSYKSVNKETGVDLVTEFSTLDHAHVTEFFLQLRRGDVGREVEVVRLRDEDELLTKRISLSITQRR